MEEDIGQSSSELTEQTLLKEIYELTSNKWKTITVDDLNSCICAYAEKEDSVLMKIDEESDRREIEIVHLFALLRLVEKDYLVSFNKQLTRVVSDHEMLVEPYYRPDIQDENQPILGIPMENDRKLVLYEDGGSTYLKENDASIFSS